MLLGKVQLRTLAVAATHMSSNQVQTDQIWDLLLEVLTTSSRPHAIDTVGDSQSLHRVWMGLKSHVA